MIFIHKGKEPDSLTAYKRQPYASYDGYEEKDELREALPLYLVDKYRKRCRE